MISNIALFTQVVDKIRSDYDTIYNEVGEKGIDNIVKDSGNRIVLHLFSEQVKDVIEIIYRKEIDDSTLNRILRDLNQTDTTSGKLKKLVKATKKLTDKDNVTWLRI